MASKGGSERVKLHKAAQLNRRVRDTVTEIAQSAQVGKCSLALTNVIDAEHYMSRLGEVAEDFSEEDYQELYETPRLLVKSAEQAFEHSCFRPGVSQSAEDFYSNEDSPSALEGLRRRRR